MRRSLVGFVACVLCAQGASAEPASAADALRALVRSVAGRALTCGLDQMLFVEPDARSLVWIGSGEMIEGRLQEVRIAIGPGTADRVAPGTVVFTLPRNRLKLRLPPARETDGRKADSAELFVDDDPTGDACAVEVGRAAFLENRFNTIRANLCGNDPSARCIAVLRRTCGISPTSACILEVKPTLDRLSQADHRR